MNIITESAKTGTIPDAKILYYLTYLFYRISKTSKRDWEGVDEGSIKPIQILKRE